MVQTKNTNPDRRWHGRLGGILFGLALSLRFACAAPVQVARGTITIPTYLLGEENPYPPFPLISHRAIYPYLMLDDLTNHREPRSYRTIVLENEFLSVIILPDVGGRVYSLYDKVNRREVFYRNNVVKYGLVALRGAWISGGIEFDFPNGHTVVTVSPISSATHVNADGSASAVVGDTDLVTGMHWEVTLTLRPGVARLEQQVKLLNSTPVENPYWFWANAAVPATDDMQFIYPMREVNPHSRTELWSYPAWKGVDYSWSKNIRQPTSLFGIQVHRNFFGAYYHSSDFAVVHVADCRQDQGKKIWSWGVAGDGLIWTKLLTDNDGAYNEVQSGRFETQLNQEFMLPREQNIWTEYWYPVKGLGGNILEATPRLALNAVWPDGADRSKTKICVAPNSEVPDAVIQAGLGGESLAKFGPLTMQADHVQCFAVFFRDLESAKKALTVTVSTEGGDKLLHWSAADPIDGNPDFVSPVEAHDLAHAPRDKQSPEEIYVDGLRKEEGSDQDGAWGDYEAALKLDPGYIPALLKMAWRAYEAADFPSAEHFVARALNRNVSDPKIHYAAGVIYRASGHQTLAQDAFWSSIHFGGPPAPAYIELGEIALGQKEFTEGKAFFRRALENDQGDPVAQTDLAVALRLAGELEPARHVVSEVLDAWPLFSFARAEKWLIEDRQAADLKTASAEPSLWDKDLTPGADTYLNVAARYRGLGDFGSSDAVLVYAKAGGKQTAESPLIEYYLASNARGEGEAARASQILKRAAALSPRRILPSRLDDAIVLAEATQANPADARALSLLGDYYFARGRYEDADNLWLQALRLGYEDAALDRNLGEYAWHVQHDLGAAARYYQSAVRLEPGEYRLYVDLDEIFFEKGNLRAREKLLASAPPPVLARDAIRAQRCLLEIQEDKFTDALQLLSDHEFNPWEGGHDIRELFVLANVTEGRQALKAHHPQDAEKAFRHALEYPENLGVGKPDTPNDEEALYWLARALEAEGKSDAARAVWRQAVGEGQRRAEAASEGGEGQFYAALVLDRLGRTAEARKFLDGLARSTASGGESALAYYLAGLVAAYRGNRPAAMVDFRRALGLDPSLWRARLMLERAGSFE